jgi:16S rRNA processing protein RimM
MVLVGRIARPQWHRGQVVVNPATDFPDERFAAGAVLHTLREGRVERLTVVAMRVHQGRPVLTLEDVGTMNEAQALAGLELRVPETELAVLPEGTYYEHDLVGCVLVTRDGRELAHVRAVAGGGGTTRRGKSRYPSSTTSACASTSRRSASSSSRRRGCSI